MYIFFCFLWMASLYSVEDMKTQTPSGSFDQIVQWAKNHQHFKQLYYKLHEEEFARLVKEGQNPKAVYIGCSDSRVLPDLLLGTKPGDLFVIRNAGNFVPTYDKSIPWDGVAATIEYAIEVLGIREIIVCGHSHCGAIQGLYTQKNSKTSITLKTGLNLDRTPKNLPKNAFLQQKNRKSSTTLQPAFPSFSN